MWLPCSLQVFLSEGTSLVHRGFSHSLIFSLLSWLYSGRARIAGYIAASAELSVSCYLATASHGVLDAYYEWRARRRIFLALVDERYFLRYQVIEVSPELAFHTFSPGGELRVILSELRWVWLP